MKKADLHIHTVATPSDASFDFDMSILEKYVSKFSFDFIAITNHNIFDYAQYVEIQKRLTIPVLPGIEINLDQGHILVISSPDDAVDFASQCQKVSEKVPGTQEALSVRQLKDIFIDLRRYLLIPHYDKKPSIGLDRLQDIREHILCGEVNSIKKFMYCQKTESELVPLYFSDIRISSRITEFPSRYTYFDIEDISISAIKLAVLDKTKVLLSSRNPRKMANKNP